VSLKSKVQAFASNLDNFAARCVSDQEQKALGFLGHESAREEFLNRRAAENRLVHEARLVTQDDFVE